MAARPGDSEPPKMLAHLYHQLGEPQKAAEVLEVHLEGSKLEANFTHANMLAELYIESRQHRKALDLIRGMIEQHCRGSAAVPLDFQVHCEAAARKMFSHGSFD